MPSIITNVYYELNHRTNDDKIRIQSLCFVCSTRYVVENLGSIHNPHVIIRNTYRSMACDCCGAFIWDSIRVNVHPDETVEYQPVTKTLENYNEDD